MPEKQQAGWTHPDGSHPARKSVVAGPRVGDANNGEGLEEEHRMCYTGWAGLRSRPERGGPHAVPDH